MRRFLLPLLLLAGSSIGCPKEEGAAIKSDPPAKPKVEESANPVTASATVAASAEPSGSTKTGTIDEELAKLEAEALAQLGGDAGGLNLGGAGGGGAGIVDLGDAGPSPSDSSYIIRRNRWRFKACYNKELGVNPKASGKITVKVDVDAKGDVTAASASSTTASKDLTDCVVRAFHSMKFVESEAGKTTLSVPIVLTATK